MEEAADIVFRGHVPPQRPADAHDILRNRHARIMGGRPDVSPGRFKTLGNRAGSTVFVAPDAVPGTLRRGFDIYTSLEAPFHRAAFMHFLVAEVHPFADGNGRLARVMMNSELIAGSEERIVIPTVYRDNYMAALRALSNRTSAEPLIRMLDFAQQFTAAVRWQALKPTHDELGACNAFETDANHRALLLPSGQAIR